MAITIPTYDTLEALVLAHYRARFPTKDLSRDSLLGRLARAEAMALLGLFQAILNADNDAIPSNKSSSEALDAFAEAYGLSDGDDGYGRRVAFAATGGTGNCTGTKGTVFPADSTLSAPDGETIFKLVTEVTIAGSPPGTGSISGTFVAVTEGEAGNLADGTVLTWQSPPAGADPTVTLATDTEGGLDEESDEDLLVRILARLQQPPKGGAASDWRSWGEAAEDEDDASIPINRAYVYPLRGGLGTVHTVVTIAGEGQERRPTPGQVSDVETYIDGVRSVTMQGQTVLRPYMPDASGKEIRVRCTPSLSAYAFDWEPGVTSYTVDTYTAGSPSTLKLNVVAPADLKAAIDDAISGGSPQTTGPRLQIRPTNATTALPYQVRVVAYDADLVKTTLTLQNDPPTGWVDPTAGDKVYAGGPIVEQCQEALLDYVDSLGPSRSGGYANELDPWEDTIAVFRLAQIVLDQEDEGTRMVKNVTSATIGGVAADVVAADNTTNGPEVLYASHIFVTD